MKKNKGMMFNFGQLELLKEYLIEKSICGGYRWEVEECKEMLQIVENELSKEVK